MPKRRLEQWLTETTSYWSFINVFLFVFLLFFFLFLFFFIPPFFYYGTYRQRKKSADRLFFYNPENDFYVYLQTDEEIYVCVWLGNIKRKRETSSKYTSYIDRWGNDRLVILGANVKDG